MQVLINTIDYTNQVDQSSLLVEDNLTSQVDTASFSVKKYGARLYTPAIGDVVEVWDGAKKIFGGTIINFDEQSISNAEGIIYSINCADYSFAFGNILVAETYEGMTIEAIITDIISNYAPGYSTTGVTCTFNITRIVFNQISIMQCLKRLADIVKYEYYVDEEKAVQFFPKFTKTAPFNLTDTSGNYIVETLKRKVDGSQIINQVKVRGGEYDGSLYTDIITVSGNDSKSFKLPYKFSNLTIEVDTGFGYVSKTIGIDFVDSFTTKDVLYNYNERTFKFNSALANGNKIRFGGNPKIPVLAIASDSDSIAEYGLREKIIKDNSIEDLTTARRRAIAEVQSFKDEAGEVNFTTFTSGLRAGMVINLTSTKRNTASDYLIKKISFRVYTSTTFAYEVTLISTKKYTLTELLQKLMEPEDVKADDTEVSESIKMDNQTVTIVENIRNIGPIVVSENLIISENIQKDPLGAGVEPIWVLADHFPTGPGDPKRVGLLGYSFRLY